jgi:hypothetical protein
VRVVRFSRDSIWIAGLLPLIGGIACASGYLSLMQETRAGSSSADVKCLIRVTSSSDFVRLEAIAQSGNSVSGQYALSILKQSATGTSQNIQSGDFTLTPDQEEILTTSVLDGSALGHYTAKLSLTWNQGRVSCRSP